MDSLLFDWLIDTTISIGSLGTWLITPIRYLNFSPLSLFSITAITTIISYKALRLVFGG